MTIEEKVLNHYNITNNNFRGNLYIHNFNAPQTEGNDYLDSYFDNGLKKQPYKNILSTTTLLTKKKDYAEQISNYVNYGNTKVLIHIPYAIDNIFLGDAYKEFDTEHPDIKASCVLDILALNAIPREFIVGVFTDLHEDKETNKLVSSNFVPNPYYFNDPVHKEENTKNLKNFLTERVEKHSGPFFKHVIDLNDSLEDWPEIRSIAHEYARADFIEKFYDWRQKYNFIKKTDVDFKDLNDSMEDLKTAKLKKDSKLFNEYLF